MIAIKKRPEGLLKSICNWLTPDHFLRFVYLSIEPFLTGCYSLTYIKENRLTMSDFLSNPAVKPDKILMKG